MLKILKFSGLKAMNKLGKFQFGSKQVPIPFLADSIQDVTVLKYLVKEGDFVKEDDEVMEVESQKGSTIIRTSLGGKVIKLLCEIDSDVPIGTNFLEIDPDAPVSEKAAPEKAVTEKTTPEKMAPEKKSSEKPVQAKPVKEAVGEKPKPVESVKETKKEPIKETVKPASKNAYVRTETKEKLSRMRKTVAERLKESQNTNAHVTTMQEIDMSEIMRIRKEIGDEFLTRNGVKLGFMSFFVKAVTRGLLERPQINSVISGSEIIHRNFIDISVAVSSPKGLVVPVLRDCELLTFADIEKGLSELAKKASNGLLSIEDMSGGTFTISNGGVFGSMLSIPIINPPQSAVLGMHNIVNRPVVRGDQIVARPIMYVSMSYDHRLLDGREGAGFLKRVCELLENPNKMLLEF